MTQLIREGPGGSAQITARIVNDTGSDVSGLQSDLRATPSDNVSILQLSGPTSLAAGQQGDAVFDLQFTSTEVVNLQFDVQGRRASDDALIAAPPEVLSISLSAPLIQSVAAQRSGDATGTAKGGERVVVTGLNLQDVTQADFDLGGVRVSADQVLVTSDTEIEFVTPKMVKDLQRNTHGDLLVDTNLILTGVTGLPEPADLAESNPYPFTFEGPVILSVQGPAVHGPGGGASGDALGNEEIAITGRNFTDVTGAAFRDSAAQQLPADITVTDDGNATIKTPDATSFLEAAASGEMAWAAQLAVFWPENLPPPFEEVASGPVPFEFEGPVVTSVEVAGSGVAAGDVRGGERVTVTGRNLGSITDVTFSFPNGPALPAGSLAVTSDNQLAFTTPYAASYLVVQPDGSTSVGADLIVSYETAHLPPHDVVTSGRTPFRFEGPQIESRSTDTVAAKGAFMTVQGHNLASVTTVTYSVEGALIEKPVSTSSDGEVGFTTPDMSLYLRTLPDGSLTVSGQLYLGYANADVAGGEVTSNRVDITFTAPAVVFSDVPPSAPFALEIGWLAASEISTGYADGTFRPTGPVSRQAMASFLFKYEKSPAVSLTEPYFADVPQTHPFYAAIQWMADSGLSLGTPQASGKPLFKPTDPVSRQAMAAFLWRLTGKPTTALTEPFFADVSGTHPFSAPIQWMAETGLSTGTLNLPAKPLYKPGSPVSRQAMAAFLYRYHALP